MNEIIEKDLREIATKVENFRDKIAGKTFLVTGGAGFLGSWLCDVLVALDANVICVDNLSSGSEKNIEHLMGRKNFQFEVNEC